MTLLAQRTVTGEVVRPDLTLSGGDADLAWLVTREADHARPFIVSLHRRGEPLAPADTTVIFRKEAALKAVGPDDVVVITYLPLGGGGSGAQVGMAVAAIALMVIAPYAVAGLGAALGTTALGTMSGLSVSLTAVGKLLATGIVMGGMALLSAAMKPKANKSDEEERPIYGVSGGGNLPRPGDRIPRLYGKCWTSPDLSQPDFFLYEGESQILYKLMTLTAGRAQVHTIRVDNQVMWRANGGVQPAFAGSEVEIVPPGQVSQLVPSAVVSSPSVQGNELPRPTNTVTAWSGPFIISAPGVEINRIQIDLSAPQGAMLNYTNSKGAQEGAAPIGWYFEYAPVDDAGYFTGPWQPLEWFHADLLSRRPLRWSRLFWVPKGRYAVRGRNVHDNAPRNERETNISNALQWDALRGYVPGKQVRENVTQIAMRIRSNAALGVTSFADVQVEATGVVPVWNGSSWSHEATRKAVWIYADIMRHAAYGAGLPDSALDLETLKFYADYLDKFDTFDGVIRGPDSVWNVAAAVLFPMRAEPVQLGRVWSLVRDERKEARRHVITSRQIVGGSSGLSFDVDPDRGTAHLVAEYYEAGDPKRKLQLPDTWYGNKSLTPTRRELFGVSRWAHATHLARWLAASAFYRRQSVRFTTEHDGRIYKRGDSIGVDLWFASQAKVAGVVDASGDVLTLDRDVSYAPGDHVIIRDRGGREWGPVAVVGISGRGLVLEASSRAAVEAETGIPLYTALALDVMEPTSVLIGQVETLRRNYIVKSAKPSGRDRIDIEAVIDADEVWNVVGWEEVPNPYGEGEVEENIQPPTGLYGTERLYLEDGRPRSSVVLNWTPANDQRVLLYEVQFAVNDGPWQAAGTTNGNFFEITDVPAGQVDFRVRSIYSALSGSVWASYRMGVLGIYAPPPDVSEFRVDIIGDNANLSWAAVTHPFWSHYEVRFSPLTSGVTWGAAAPLMPRVGATHVQVPAMVGTYAIKAVTMTGAISRNAVFVVSDIAGIAALNVVETLVEAPAFPGTKDGVTVIANRLRLDSTSVLADWPDLASIATIYVGTSSLADGGTYTFADTVDLGAVYTSRLTAVIDAFGETVSENIINWTSLLELTAMDDADPADWSVRVEYRKTNDDPSGSPLWSDWTPLVVGDVQARALQFRALLEADDSMNVVPVVRGLTVGVDMPDRVEAGQDIAVGTGGTTIAFAPAFKELRGIAIAAQDMATGDYYTITSKSESGFSIQFRNAAGTGVARTFDFVAKGFGIQA